MKCIWHVCVNKMNKIWDSYLPSIAMAHSPKVFGWIMGTADTALTNMVRLVEPPTDMLFAIRMGLLFTIWMEVMDPSTYHIFLTQHSPAYIITIS